MKRNIFKSMLVAALLATANIAAKFNTNASAPSIVPAPTPARRRSFSTGIKGVANTNNTRSGANLKAYFDKRNTKLNEHGVMVKA